ncbi:MAG: DUF6502 family protein [Pseudomonadota bacterium]
MVNLTEHVLLRAVFSLLRPIVRMLVRAGISHQEFSQLAKMAFVDVVSRDHGVRGRPANLARISAATGISRREVARVRAELQSQPAITDFAKSMSARVLQLWSESKDLRGPSGAPLDLPYESSGKEDFTSLVERLKGDIPPGAVKAELLRSGCIEETNAGLLRLVRTVFLDPSEHDRLVRAVGNQLCFHAETVLHNTDAANQSCLRHEKIVSSNRLRRADLERFRRVTDESINAFINSYAATVTAYDQWAGEDHGSTAELTGGVGIYYFERSSRDD